MAVARSWREFITSDARFVAAKAAPTGAGGKKLRVRDIRMEYAWRPLADPGEANRGPDKEKGIEPADYDPINVRIIPRDNGELFLDYKSTWVKHAKGGYNTILISNAHNGARPEFPDLLYIKYLAAGNADSVFEGRDNTAVKLELLEDFHIIETVRGKSNFKKKEYKRCSGHRCEHCAGGVPKAFGRIVHWSMFPAQRRSFEKQLHEMQARCANCSKGYISAALISCPECAAVYYDLNNGINADMDEDTVDALSTQAVSCSNCTYVGLLNVAAYNCEHVTGYGANRRRTDGCGQGRRYEVSETIFTLSSVKSGKVTSYDISNPTLLEAAELPIRVGSEGTPPFSLEALFDTMSISEQAEILGLADNDVKELVGGFSIGDLELQLSAAKNGEPDTGYDE